MHEKQVFIAENISFYAQLYVMHLHSFVAFSISQCSVVYNARLSTIHAYHDIALDGLMERGMFPWAKDVHIHILCSYYPYLP